RASVEDMERLTGADIAHAAGTGTEVFKTLDREIGGFDAVVPRGKVGAEAVVHLLKRGEFLCVDFGGDERQEVNVADVEVEIAGDERAVEVDADEVAAENSVHFAEETFENLVDERVGG